MKRNLGCQSFGVEGSESWRARNLRTPDMLLMFNCSRKASRIKVRTTGPTCFLADPAESRRPCTHRMWGDMVTTRYIDLTRSVYSLCQEYPELIGILETLGFKEITKSGMLGTAGRIMTIPKGAAMRGISMDDIRSTLLANGFEMKEGQA